MRRSSEGIEQALHAGGKPTGGVGLVIDAREAGLHDALRRRRKLSNQLSQTDGPRLSPKSWCNVTGWTAQQA